MSETHIVVRHGADGRPVGAVASARIDHPVAKVWEVVTDVERYPGRVPMIHKVTRQGDRVTIDLKFKVSLFSVGFQFTVDAIHEEQKWVELAYVSGEPREIRLRYELVPLDGGKATELRCDAQFDVQSLGWLTKYFLKNHPEIEYGIFPGVSLSLVDAMKKAAAL